MSMTTVAVYGTLRKGQGNHILMDAPSTKFIGKGQTIEPAVMISTGGFPILDFASAQHEENVHLSTSVTVEVYEVDDETLVRLDRLEGYPSWYNRTERPMLMENGDEVKAFIYYQDHCTSRGKGCITNGDWVERVGYLDMNGHVVKKPSV